MFFSADHSLEFHLKWADLSLVMVHVLVAVNQVPFN